MAEVKKKSAKVTEKSEVKPAKAVAKKEANAEPRAKKVVVEEAPQVAEQVVRESAARRKHVLLAASECQPFFGTGGLGDVVASLPKAINNEYGDDVEVTVILPLYDKMNSKFRDKLTYVTSFGVSLAWRKQHCGVFELVYNNTKFYFLDNEFYFKRGALYGCFDDAERFAYFSHAVLDAISVLNLNVDIIHCNDWQTALIPVYLKLHYFHRPEYSDIRTIFTIHNIEYQGNYDHAILEYVLGIDNSSWSILEYAGRLNFMKGAIVTADRVTTVSQTYSQEIMTEYYSHGLYHILRENSYKVSGIVNGIDYEEYNAENDECLFKNFTVNTIEDKMQNKEALQKMVDLNIDANVPMFAMITRLAEHKGIDLVKYALERVLSENIQVVLVGTGESHYEEYFRNLAKRYPKKVAALITFNKDLAHKVYAAADAFIMPSKSEPCGLAQMICSRYGTVPIVRETGGLADTVLDYGAGGNGFTFAAYNAEDLLYTIRRASGIFHNKEEWKALSQKVMGIDFSWKASAKKYIDLYNLLFQA